MRIRKMLAPVYELLSAASIAHNAFGRGRQRDSILYIVELITPRGKPLKLHQGKDKTFFFFAYEGNRRRVSTPQQFSVPTAEMRQSNLVGLPGGAAIDPFTGAPFPNQQIPADRISPVSARLLQQYYPLPNFGSATDTNANARRLTLTPSDTNGYDVRIDHVINSKQQIYGRWSWKNVTATVPNVILPSEVTREYNRNFIVSHNYSLTQNVINEFRFGVSHSNLKVAFPIKGADAIADLGLVGLDISNHPNTNAFPTFNFSDGTGFTSIGRDKTGTTRSSTFQYTDNLTWVKNKHTMKFGFDVRRLRYFDIESFGGSDDFGQFTFTAGNFTGNAFVDFLLGLPATTYVAKSGPDIDAQATHSGFYAQDEWHVNNRLTFNFGLRWQLLPPFTEKNGNITVFDKTNGGVIIPGISQPTPGFLTSINACPGINPNLPCAEIRTARQAGLGQGLRHTYYRNFQPRLSFAYRPFENGKTVIRGGFGLFTMTNLGQLSFNITDIHVSDLRTYVNTLEPGRIPAYQFPRIGSVDRPIDIAGTGEFYQNVPIDYRDPQSAQWNLTIERELPSNPARLVTPCNSLERAYENKKIETVMLLGMVGTLFIIAGSPLGSEEPKPILSKKELKWLIAHAKDRGGSSEARRILSARGATSEGSAEKTRRDGYRV